MPGRPTNRRGFLKTTAVALTVPSVIPSTAIAARGRPGANDRIYVGMISPGGRSKDLTKESPADLKLVAVADCDLRQIAKYLTTVRQFKDSIVAEKCSQYQDYREMVSM